ncbi:MAG: class IV adenylate cyclase [Elusimicrobia bacterium]|nr:class IV adenylate cyclase [Elusimicrobiota bacterium]
MPTNIEIKAKAADWDGQLSRARALCGRTEELTQTDTFFRCKNGRLKLRDLGSRGGSCLIFYRRPDRPGPKESAYETSAVSDPASMRKVLAKAWGEGKTVRKKRTVLWVGRTRVHFDEVEGLGRFIELEVCLEAGQTPPEGETIARDLMARLGIEAADLLEGAYVEMLTLGRVNAP